MRAVQLHFFPAGAILAWTPWSVFFQSLNHQWKRLESCLAWLLTFSWTTVCSWCLCLSCKSWQSLFFEQSQNNLQSLFFILHSLSFHPTHTPKNTQTPPHTHLLFLFWLSSCVLLSCHAAVATMTKRNLLRHLLQQQSLFAATSSALHHVWHSMLNPASFEIKGHRWGRLRMLMMLHFSIIKPSLWQFRHTSITERGATGQIHSSF